MSGKVSGWVWDQEDLTLQEKYILLSYADHASHDGRNIYPSNKLTAKKTGLTKRSIQRYTRSLEEKGFLIPDGKYQAKNGQWLNKWRIPVDAGATPMSPPTKGVTPEVKRDDTGDQKGRQSSVTQTVIEPLEEPSVLKEATKDLPDNGKPTKKHKRSNSTPPAVELTRRITHRYPAKKLHGMIERAVGDDFASLLKWGRVVKQWIGSGYNPMNYTGMINVFRHGWNNRHGKDEKNMTPGVAMIMKRAQQRAEAERR